MEDKHLVIKYGLTTREEEIAREVCTGASNQEIATKFFVTEKTVKFHLTNIYKKMGVKTRCQLMAYCLNTTLHALPVPQSLRNTPYLPSGY